jgi:16S rRNA (guanine527-N7)-methyltransferase
VKLSEVAPAHAVRALGRILELQATDPTASTTVKHVPDAVSVHVADALVALELPYVARATRIADLGSGAGWPGLALAAALPAAHVSLVESQIRHCRYLEKAVEIGELTNVSVVNVRAEAWPEGLGRNELVTARAVAALPVVLEYAAPLLADGGHFVAWKGAVDEAERADGLAAAEILGLEPLTLVSVRPFPGARDHTLHPFRRIAPTPERFPRRPGMAAKRPLRA